MTAPTTEPLVSVRDLAAHLGVSPRTLHNWRERGMPHYGGGGSTLRFRVSEVEAWMRGNGPDDDEESVA